MRRVVLSVALGVGLCACGGNTEGEPGANCMDLQQTALDRCAACDMDAADYRACDLLAEEVAASCGGMLSSWDTCNTAVAAGDCSVDGLWPATCQTQACRAGGTYQVSSTTEVLAGYCRYDTGPSTYELDPGDPLHPEPECIIETEWSADDCRVVEIRDCVFPGVAQVHTEETLVFLSSGDYGWGTVLTQIQEDDGSYCEARFHMFHERI